MAISAKINRNTLSAVDPEMGAEAPGIGFAIDSNTRPVRSKGLGAPRC
ncbi:MAG TPA: hypothetical protein VGH93_13705 [Solirubrobacteraceae bacterium]